MGSARFYISRSKQVTRIAEVGLLGEFAICPFSLILGPAEARTVSRS